MSVVFKEKEAGRLDDIGLESNITKKQRFQQSHLTESFK